MSIRLNPNINLNILKNKRYIFFSISMCKLLYGIYLTSIGPLLVMFGQTYNINLKMQSFVFPSIFIGQVFIIFYIGFLADKIGKKIIKILALLIFSITSLFFLVASSYAEILLIFLITGISASSINLISDVTITDYFKKNKSFYINLSHVFFGLGALVSPVIFNIIFTGTSNYRFIYIVFSVLSLLLFILVLPVDYPKSTIEKVNLASIKMVAANKEFIYLCIFYLLGAGVQNTVSGWIPTLFEKEIFISKTISNYSLAFLWLSIILGRIATAYLSKKIREQSLIKYYTIIIFIIILFSGFLSKFFFLISFYILFGFFMGGLLPLLQSFSTVIHKDSTGIKLGMIASSAAIGNIIIPSLVGSLGDYFYINKLIPFTSVFFAVMALYYFKKYRTKSR
jgi:MFS family permease